MYGIKKIEKNKMNKIIYKKGDLFTVKGNNTILAHACNCKGVWGSGIAVKFKELFPESFKDYSDLCKKHDDQLVGMSVQYWGESANCRKSPGITYLFTSYGYGPQKDSEKQILKNTRTSISCLLTTVSDGTEIHTPKINSGAFGVPWEKTEKVINECLESHPKVRWYVWELEESKNAK